MRYGLAMRFILLFLTTVIASPSLVAQAQSADGAYPFAETVHLDFFKRDIRDREYSTAWEEELMGQASRNGIMIGVFGGTDAIFQRVERTIGEAHVRGLPVAMAIADPVSTPTNEIPNAIGDVRPHAVIMVFVGGGRLYLTAVYEFTGNIEVAVTEMIEDAHVQFERQREN